jgi:hypothetical protein
MKMVPVVLSAAVASMILTVGNARAETIVFDPGTYYLADSYFGDPVDILVVTVSGGVATFDLTGNDNWTFTVPSPSTPTGDYSGNPYYEAPAFTANWNTATYPYLTFWYASSFGGLTAGSLAGDGNEGETYVFDLFQSDTGPGQVFSVTPLPASWVMMLSGLAALGFVAAHRRRKNDRSAVVVAA